MSKLSLLLSLAADVKMYHTHLKTLVDFECAKKKLLLFAFPLNTLLFFMCSNEDFLFHSSLYRD